MAFFEGESLQGLEVGASVKFNGVNIGKVQRVSYTPEDINKMKVEMSVVEGFPMRVDMYASTGMIGITGLKYIEVSGGSNEAARLKPGGVVPTRPTLFATVGERVDTLANQVEVLLRQLNRITNPDSLSSIKIALDNLADLTGDAKVMFRDIRDVVPATVGILDTVQSVTNEVLRITKDIKDVTASVKEGVEGGNIPGLIARVDSTASSVKVLTDNVSLMVLQTREDISVSMENLREAMESANQLMKALAENPSLLIRGEGGRDRDRR
jgi:ABC-type transporter Mla subunit MlaD